MFSSRNGDHSGPGSSRAASTARETMKKREKPYKVEKAKVLSKKRKLDLHTSYKRLPAGYVFLPVGTPELAEGCKELSRQRGIPVDIVNAKPVSKHATDPTKVSHHIHRVGYHFRADIVEEACAELGYINLRGKFVKEADAQQQSHIAQIMARHGFNPYQTKGRETDEEVSAVIKELFPKIPDDDMKQILDHAWKEGTHRVGTNATLDLPRRVQLATIARIRHTYTDYDYLLHAFPWKDARLEVEQTCLKKLLEWRGEEAEDDDVMEELVRDVIVLDDDDAAGKDHEDEADDEDSLADIDDSSDESVEFTHERVMGHDLGAESAIESPRSSVVPYPSLQRNMQQQNNIARQRIGEAKRQMQIQSGRPPATYVQHPYEGRNPYTGSGEPRTIGHKINGGERAPETITVGGQVYRLMPEQRPMPSYPSPYTQASPQAHTVTEADYSGYIDVPHRSEVGPYAALHDRPIPSIERDTTHPQQQQPFVPVPVHERAQPHQMRYRPAATGEMERYLHRPQPEAYVPQEAYAQLVRRAPITHSQPRSSQIIDLTSPEPQVRQYYARQIEPIPHDPRQPLLEMPPRYESTQPQHGAPAPVQPYHR